MKHYYAVRGGKSIMMAT